MRKKVNSSENNLASQVSELRSKLQAIAEKPAKDLTDFTLARQIEDRLVPLERELALENGEPAAFRLGDWPVSIAKYDRLLGVISVGHSLIVWHEILRMKSPKCALFGCDWCIGVRRESSSETGFLNHPLYRHGLDRLGAFLVRNSEWKKSLARRLTLKSDGAGNWSKSEHYLFLFEDDAIEFIATGLKFLNVYETFVEAEQEISARLSVLIGLPR
jgi:hypothetical protein